MMERFRRTAALSLIIATAALLAGCSGAGGGNGNPYAVPEKSSPPTPTAPIVNIPAAIDGEVARATFSGSGASDSVAVASAVAGVTYVVKAQCSSTSGTDKVSYQVLVDGKAAAGTGTGEIACDGTPLLAPTVAPPAGSAVTVTLGDLPAGVGVAYAIVEPQQ